MKQLLLLASLLTISLGLLGCNSMGNAVNDTTRLTNNTVGTGVKYTARTVGTGINFVGNTGAAVGKGVGSMVNTGTGFVDGGSVTHHSKPMNQPVNHKQARSN